MGDTFSTTTTGHIIHILMGILTPHTTNCVNQKCMVSEFNTEAFVIDELTSISFFFVCKNTSKYQFANTTHLKAKPKCLQSNLLIRMLLKIYADIAEHGDMIVYLKIIVALFQHSTYLSIGYLIYTYSSYRFSQLLTLKFSSLLFRIDIN